MIQRMNDAVMVLTRATADRNETAKNLRVIKREISNVFLLTVHNLKGQIPAHVFKEAWGFKLYSQIETIANYVLGSNRVLNDDGEYIMQGDEKQKLV